MKSLAFALLLMKFADPACHVRFETPRGWTIDVKKKTDVRVCEIAMEPRNWKELLEKDDGVRLHGVSVEIMEGNLETVLQSEGTFERRDGAWVILGRQGIESPASEIARNGWKGLTGISESGCHHEEGGYAGLCPVAVALVSNGKWSAIVAGAPQSHDQFDRVMKSLKLE